MEKIIQAIRESFVGAEEVYTKGSCFQFYLIIKSICPYAEPWYDGVDGHIYSKVGNKFYDIFGELKDQTILDRIYDLREEPNLFKQAYEWKWGMKHEYTVSN